MSRPIKTIKLSACEVDILTYLTWGEQEDIQSVMLKGAKLQSASGNVDFDASVLIEAKFKLLEVAVKEVRVDGIANAFTREWMRDLSVEDGDTLYAAVDDLSKKKSATPTS
jgi:hypothetical protein